MTPVRRFLALAIVVVGLAGIVAAVGSTVGAREKRRTFTRPASVTAVEVEIDNGRVEVVAGTELEPRIRQTTRSLFAAPKLQESVIDGVLRLRAECPRLAGPTCEVRYRVEVPATVAVRVRTDRGSVSVDGMTGAVDVAADAGRISLARTSGPVTARTSAGSIEGVDLSPAFLDASTGAGRIRMSLEKPSARVDLRTGAGNIDVALPPDRYRVETETDAGKIDVAVTVDATSPYVVRARTGAGGIRVRPR